MLVQDFLQAHVPNDVVQPVSHYIPPLPLKIIILHLLWRHMQHLARRNRLPLRPILFQVLRQVKIINVFIYTAQPKQQLGRDIHCDVHALWHQCKLETELITEKLKLLFLDVFVLFYYGLHVGHF